MNISPCSHFQNRHLCLYITLGAIISIIGVALIAAHASTLYQGIGCGILAMGGIVILAALIHACCRNREKSEEPKSSIPMSPQDAGREPITTSIHSEQLMEQSPEPLPQVSLISDTLGPPMHPSFPSLCDHLDPELRFPEPSALSGGVKREPPVLTRPLDPEKAQWTQATLFTAYSGMFVQDEEWIKYKNFSDAWYRIANKPREFFRIKQKDRMEDLEIFLPNEHALAWLALKYQNSYQISLSVIGFEDLETQLLYKQNNPEINPYFGLFVIGSDFPEKDNYWMGTPLLFHQNFHNGKLECAILGGSPWSMSYYHISKIVKKFNDKFIVEKRQEFTLYTTSLFNLLVHALIDLKARPQTLQEIFTPMVSSSNPSEWTFGGELDNPDENPLVSLPITSELSKRQLTQKYKKHISYTFSTEYTLLEDVGADSSESLHDIYKDINKKITNPLPQGAQLFWDEKTHSARLFWCGRTSINTFSHALSKAHFEIFFNERYQAMAFSRLPQDICCLITHYLHDPIQRRFGKL